MRGRRVVTREVLLDARERGLDAAALALELGITRIALRAAARRLDLPFPDGRVAFAAQRLNADRELLAERMRQRRSDPAFIAKLEAGIKAGRERRAQEKARREAAEAEAAWGARMAEMAARERAAQRRAWA